MATNSLIRGIQGVDKVISNLRKQRRTLALGVERGIKKAALKLQRESQRLVPVNFGVLKASAFTRTRGSGWDTQAWIGYTAVYAIFVHEAVGMVLKGKPRPKGRGKYWDPQGRGQAKFLEEPARRLRPELLQIIKDSAKIK